MSVYQLIRQEVMTQTPIGLALAASKREKAINFGDDLVFATDKFDEENYSAVHFDQNLVVQLVQQKIAENRTSQRFILLEGFCNSNKLKENEQRLQLRFMDEFFAIERNIGEVVGVIGLQSEQESTMFDVTPDMIEEPKAEEPPEEEEKKGEGEEEEE